MKWVIHVKPRAIIIVSYANECLVSVEGMDVWMDEWVDGWVDGWMDGWLGGWVDGWMDKTFSFKLYVMRYGSATDWLCDPNHII